MAPIKLNLKENNTNNSNRFKYLILYPDKGGLWNLIKYLILGNTTNAIKLLLDSSDEEEKIRVASHHKYVILFIIVRRTLALISRPLKYTGFVVDFFLNLLSDNGGHFFGLLINFLHGKLVMPRKDSETYISNIGQLDGRIDLYKKPQNLVKQIDNDADSASTEAKIKVELGDPSLMDLCIMSAKLAFENAKVVKNIINNHWKMHFVDFYDCWNDHQKKNNTQVFILSDKPKDANLILVSFRGREIFNACDWSKDIDFSWYEIPNVGKIHIGFLEALGLGNRANATNFQCHLQRQNKKFNSPTNTNSDKEQSIWGYSFDTEEAVGTKMNRKLEFEMVKRSAFYEVKRKLESLLREHKNAKFVVTGFSLGGALAILFPTLLIVQEEMELMERLLGVYTFGQPRIGDIQLGKFMETHLNNPLPKYFRVVYCNDIVPRMPFAEHIFSYKHFGVCLYYDSCYSLKKLVEEPNPNFFGLKCMIPMHLNAGWELMRSIAMGYIHGPEYKEGWCSTIFRVIGLALPGISAHGPRDYVNCVRLGKERASHVSSMKTFLHK